jgi:SAM-dependent methyltransferase
MNTPDIQVTVDVRCCPSCQSTHLLDRGEIPATNQFAGQTLVEIHSGGHLYRCENCFLQFKFPIVSRKKMDWWYNLSSTQYWPNEVSSRNDTRLARDCIRSKLSSGSVLDVGCFSGLFLASLGAEYKLYGIELNTDAAAVAERKGVTIVGRTYEDLDMITEKFDVVTAIDLIEHVVDPLVLLRLMKKVLRPGGVIIISSGNSDAYSWKLMGSRYGYSAVAEHVAFINKRWCLGAAEKQGLQCDDIFYFSHSKASMLRAALDAIKNMTYLFFPGLVALLRTCGRTRADGIGHVVNPPPPWSSARDHMIVQFSLSKDKNEMTTKTND